MLTDTEERHLHNILEELLTNPGQPMYFIHMDSTRQMDSGLQVVLMERLKHLNLVHSPYPDSLYVQLTPQGLDVARHLGGYLGHKQQQADQQQQAQQEQAERDKLEQDANRATVSSADSAVSAARAAWVAAVFGLVGVIISSIALMQPDKTEPLQKQVTALQQQVATLQAKVAAQAQLPQAAQPQQLTGSGPEAHPQPSKVRNH